MANFTVCCEGCGSVAIHLKIVNNSSVMGKCLDCKQSGFIHMNQPDSEFIVNFGKYKGHTVGEICRMDCQYAEWIAFQSTIPDHIKAKFSNVVIEFKKSPVQTSFKDEAF